MHVVYLCTEDTLGGGCVNQVIYIHVWLPVCMSLWLRMYLMGAVSIRVIYIHTWLLRMYPMGAVSIRVIYIHTWLLRMYLMGAFSIRVIYIHTWLLRIFPMGAVSIRVIYIHTWLLKMYLMGAVSIRVIYIHTWFSVHRVLVYNFDQCDLHPHKKMPDQLRWILINLIIDIMMEEMTKVHTSQKYLYSAK